MGLLLVALAVEPASALQGPDEGTHLSTTGGVGSSHDGNIEARAEKTLSSGSGGKAPARSLGGNGVPRGGSEETLVEPEVRIGCDTDAAGAITCRRVTVPDDPASTSPATSRPAGPDVETVVIEVLTTLRLPAPTIHFGPDPSRNEWGMIPVGYPLWLWTDGRHHMASAASRSGITVTLDASPGTTVFQMGDGNSLSCTAQPVKPAHGEAGRKGPCSYVYQRTSRGHPYTVTATTTWTVVWTAAGRTGTLTVPRRATAPIMVGELQSIVETVDHG
jgi:hypothetical protein